MHVLTLNSLNQLKVKEMMNSLHTKLIDKRKYLRMTQQELANRTGLSARTIQRMESGKTTPQDHSIKRMMEVLQIDEEYVDNSQGFKLARRVINGSILLAVIAPINLIVHIILGIVYCNVFTNNRVVQKVVGFQIFWTAFQVIIILAFPLISYISTGERVNGAPVFLWFTYLMTVVVNIVFLIWWSMKLKVSRLSFMN